MSSTWSAVAAPIPRGHRPHPAVVLGVVLGAAVLVALSLVAELQSPGGRALFAVDVAVGALSCALVALLFSRPVAAGLVIAVLAAVSPVVTPASGAGVVSTARTQPFARAAVVTAVSIVAHGVRGLWRPYPGLSYGWWVLIVVAVHAALLFWGALSQARQVVLDSLRERAERAEADQDRRLREARAAERARIAREMHDVLAHRLSLLATSAGALEFRPDASPAQVARAAGVVRAGTHQALEELREVIGVLRADEAVAAHAPPRPQPRFDDLDRLVAESRDAGVRVVLVRDGLAADAVPDALGRTAYRVIQEALTNARKHAPGEPVDIVLSGRPGDWLVVAISNRLAEQPASPPPGASAGLVGVAERVELIGGELVHGVTDGRFRLEARLPWPP